MIPTSLIKRKPTEKGESIEDMIRRCTESNEPIENGTPIIWTEEKDGVLPQYDIRADRFELALDAIDKVQKSAIAQSDNKPDETGKPSAQVKPEDTNG